MFPYSLTKKGPELQHKLDFLQTVYVQSKSFTKAKKKITQISFMRFLKVAQYNTDIDTEHRI